MTKDEIIAFCDQHFNEFADISNVTEQQWHELRQKGIGGSDVGAILGVSPYRSIIDVYTDKIATAPIITPQSESMYWGTKLETIIADTFTEKTGKPYFKPTKMYVHPVFKYMLANLDGVTVDDNGNPAILEIKTANEYVKEEWRDGHIPDTYYAQVQHYMCITGLNMAYVVVLIGGQTFKIVPIERDTKYINKMIQKEIAFWNNVVAKTMPQPDGTTATVNALNKILTNSVPNTTAPMSYPEELLCQMYINADKRIKDAELEKNECANLLKVMLDNNGVDEMNSSKFTVTWRTDKNGIKRFKIKST